MFSGKHSFLSRIMRKRLFRLILLKKTKSWKFPFFDKNHGLIPLKIVELFDFFKTLFFVSRKHFLLTRTMRKTFLPPYLAKQKFKMAIFLTKTMDLFLWKLSNYFYFLKTLFFLSRKHSLLSKIMRSRLICLILRRKTKVEKAIFGRKPWTNPFGKFVFFLLF